MSAGFAVKLLPKLAGIATDSILASMANGAEPTRFLPERNGIVVYTLHVVLHSATLLALALALLE